MGYPVGYRRAMDIDPSAAQDIMARLRRVEGQIAGIVRMIEDGRDCRDVVHQIAAAGRALDRAGMRVLSTQLRRCLADEEAGRPSSYAPEELERLFLSLT
jgi:CsoR family transcriptional regulator, copper-sensing transcriptional repressor